MLHSTPASGHTHPALPGRAIQRSSELALVVEDQALVGLDLCDGLEAFGYVVAGPFTRCRNALAWVQRFTPSFAILDYRLRDGCCLELARELRRLGVPFVIYSGHERTRDFATEFPNAPWLTKPVSVASVLAACDAQVGHLQFESTIPWFLARSSVR